MVVNLPATDDAAFCVCIHMSVLVACSRPAKGDAPAVATLKELGGMLIGKATMNEFGVLPHGLNAHQGQCLLADRMFVQSLVAAELQSN